MKDEEFDLEDSLSELKEISEQAPVSIDDVNSCVGLFSDIMEFEFDNVMLQLLYL